MHARAARRDAFRGGQTAFHHGRPCSKECNFINFFADAGVGLPGIVAATCAPEVSVTLTDNVAATLDNLRGAHAFARACACAYAGARA
eukprot:2150984-Pleurochrysis_carterae.AAC.3